MPRRRVVSWTKVAATAGLLMCASTLRAQEVDPREALNAQVASHFAAMQQIASRFSTPEAAGKLIDVLVAGDAKGFNALLDGLDLPLTGKCWWAHEMTERAFETETNGDQYFLKENMTPAQRQLYLMIALKYGVIAPGAAYQWPGGLFQVEDRVAIAPGPFLDELIAAGLVDKVPAKTTRLASVPIVGDPFYFCVEDGRQR